MRRPCLPLRACCLLLGLTPLLNSQTGPYERTYSESPAQVEKTLKGLQASAGRLPVLDGFVMASDHPSENYQRGYYQCTVSVGPAASGGSQVKVNAKITAWYADPDPSKSGYRLLRSNGRIESDILDRLGEALGENLSQAASPAQATNSAGSVPTENSVAVAPVVVSKQPGPNSPFKLGSAAAASSEAPATPADPHTQELIKQAKSLQEILRNQAHPTNLAAVRKADTPVLASPSENAKALFLASAEDEFEVLDLNASWAHVRISGLSRGWIRRSALEIPGEPVTEATAAAPAATSPSESDSRLFQVENEQTATFPGNWEPLRGKTVKIISVQESTPGSPGAGSEAKLEFVKSMFNREYAELTSASSTSAGVVLIFDSVDGGMLAATLPTLRSWKDGTLSDEALWRRCYFDPPEMFSPLSGQ